MSDFLTHEWPLISVVIPVRNEERYISRTIRYLLDQDYPADKMEIIVVDGRSDDTTRSRVEEIMAGDSRVRLLDNPRKLSSAGRNIGVMAAGGDIITFIDGHVYIANNQLIKSAVTLMAENGVSVLSRPQFLDTPDNNLFQRAVAAARKSKLGHGLDSTIFLKEDRSVSPTSSGASYKKEIFGDVGYFDETFDAAEDVDFNYRVALAGYKSFSSIKLAVYYFPRNNLKGLFMQMARYGTGRYRLFRKHREGVASGAMMIALFFIILAGLIIGSLFFRPLLPFLGIYGGVYLLAVIISSATVAMRGEIRQSPFLPVIYLTIHFGLVYGIIKEAIKTIFHRKKRLAAE